MCRKMGVTGENISEGLIFIASIMAISVISVMFLLIRDKRKLADKGNIYVVKAYIMSIRQGRNVRVAVLAYYDYLQGKCVSVQPSLNAGDIAWLQQWGNFVNILVAEKNGKVKYIDWNREAH